MGACEVPYTRAAQESPEEHDQNARNKRPAGVLPGVAVRSSVPKGVVPQAPGIGGAQPLF